MRFLRHRIRTPQKWNCAAEDWFDMFTLVTSLWIPRLWQNGRKTDKKRVAHLLTVLLKVLFFFSAISFLRLQPCPCLLIKFGKGWFPVFSVIHFPTTFDGIGMSFRQRCPHSPTVWRRMESLSSLGESVNQFDNLILVVKSGFKL